MSPGAPDSPDRSCQEPVSTARRHKQFADIYLSVYLGTSIAPKVYFGIFYTGV